MGSDTRTTESSSPENEYTGRVVGYEMQVVCPVCEYATSVREVGGEKTVVCGEDVRGMDTHGCGRELTVTVQPVNESQSDSESEEGT